MQQVASEDLLSRPTESHTAAMVALAVVAVQAVTLVALLKAAVAAAMVVRMAVVAEAVAARLLVDILVVEPGVHMAVMAAVVEPHKAMVKADLSARLRSGKHCLILIPLLLRVWAEQSLILLMAPAEAEAASVATVATLAVTAEVVEAQKSMVPL